MRTFQKNKSQVSVEEGSPLASNTHTLTYGTFLMTSAVSYTLQKTGVALLRIQAPPVNSLGLAVRQGLIDGLASARADGAKAIVVVGDGRTFPAGADISEFASGGHLTSPSLSEVIDELDASTIPTVAAIHGTALGGGLELALAMHYRVMDAGARCGLPEVHLGILPGGGGTQRLPRLVGCEKAIDLITTGKTIRAADALELTLADSVVARGDDLVESAVAYAASIADAPIEGRIVSAQPVRGVPVDAEEREALFNTARGFVAQRMRGYEAPLKIVDAVEAAATSTTFKAGLEREWELFAELAAGQQAAALQYVFFAERKVARVDPAVTPHGTFAGVDKATTAGPLNSAVIVGSGTMGGGIAMCLANKGIPVTIVDNDAAALERGVATVRANYERTASKGKLSAADVEKVRTYNTRFSTIQYVRGLYVCLTLL